MCWNNCANVDFPDLLELLKLLKCSVRNYLLLKQFYFLLYRSPTHYLASISLFGCLSTDYPHAVYKGFLMHGSHKLYLKLHMHGRINFYWKLYNLALPFTFISCIRQLVAQESDDNRIHVLCARRFYKPTLDVGVLEQDFSNCGLRVATANGVVKQTTWQFRCTRFCNLCKKTRSRPAVSFFYYIFRGNAVLHAVSCSLGCLPELSNDNNQPSTASYALLLHGGFSVLANIDFVAFTVIRRHACV